MKESFYLAFRYLAYHHTRSTVLIFSIGIIIYLPNGLKKLIDQSELQLRARASTTPLIVGAKGSSTDIVINALYFERKKTETISMKSLQEITGTGLAKAIPISCMFSSRKFPIVGTDLDYFAFRDLDILEGRWMSLVGECVIGYEVSEQLSIGVGDSLISSPDNFFDLAGVYPLKMNVVGVLDKANTADDRGIFVDVKTSWVIMGLGHGHDDLTQVEDQSVIMQRDSAKIKANAKLYMYNTISQDNIEDFHFHGNMDDYPVSALIVVPHDHKSETILRGKFVSGELPHQSIVPLEVIDNLLQSIFRIRHVFNTVFMLVGIATLLILGLIIALSIRLRNEEIYTMFTIGSSRGKVVQIIGAEMMILLGGSMLFATILYTITGFFVDVFIQRFIL